MGVDASYLYGYGADINEIEWDIEYLKEKYKDNMNDRVDDKYSWTPTWRDFIDNLEKCIKEEEGDENYEGYQLSEILEDANNLFKINYTYDDIYLTFNHKHISRLHPNAKLCDLDEVAKLYAKELGIKNVDVIKWIEWGYFS